MFRLAVIFILGLAVTNIDGHGRFLKPPSRSSVWRVPAFSHLNPPPNYNDNELFCANIPQELVVGSNCGLCGDPYSQPQPRDNEVGGQYYRGIITGQYLSGQTIDIEVEITAAHMGYMEWRLCDSPQNGETQECFRHLLQKADGSGSKVPVEGTGWYRTQLLLPAGVSCSRCVIQWNYRAGNNNGLCEDGSSRLGCGPQETFRGCSDVSIN